MSLVVNKNITKKQGDNSTKVFSHEPYAQEMYDILSGMDIVKKDVEENEMLRVIDFKIVSKETEEMMAICENYISLYFNFSKEKRYFDILKMNFDDFCLWLDSSFQRSFLEENKIYIKVENKITNRGSLYKAHLQKLFEEFKEQINKPKNAYYATVMSKNQGGFLVDIQGITAFLPGSLAAANKINDFDLYLGKEIPVMIEDYFSTTNIFVVSFKKYLECILPNKLSKLKKNCIMTGTVTGTSKYGIFMEFDEIFTGLLHVAEMSTYTLDNFNKGEIFISQEMTVWLKDIKNDKLILTEIDPSLKLNKYEDYASEFEGKSTIGKVISVKAHGAFLDLGENMIGFLSLKEMKKMKKFIVENDIVNVIVKKVDVENKRIYLIKE